MQQNRTFGIVLAIATLFILFFDLLPPTDLIARVLIGLGWITLVVMVFTQRRERLRQEEARLAAHMEMWMAAALKEAEKKKQTAPAADAAPAPEANSQGG